MFEIAPHYSFIYFGLENKAFLSDVCQMTFINDNFLYFYVFLNLQFN